MSSENNKRIAKNTLLLYFRMILTMLVSLYTVRVVLNTLGAIDYGIYNVVGGVVTFFSFLSGTMASASQRFFSFELGNKNYDQLKKTFSMTMTIYLLVGVIILILAETLGLWFLNTQMTIPIARIEATNWIYQFSIFSFMMTMFTIPYNASIIAHEEMKVYAYVSIIEVTLKLVIVYLLVLFSFDKLKLYSLLTFVVAAIVTLIYRTYCKRKFIECRYTFYWNLSLFKEIVSFSGWNLFGALAGVFNGQGVNILLNLFFGPVVNAAKGIATQVNGTVGSFVFNYMTATNPQIIKYYAANEKENMFKLMCRSSRISYLLLFILTMPIMLETDYIFTLWLKVVPGNVTGFVRLILIVTLIDSLSYPLMVAAQATGKIRKYQIIIGTAMILNFPISFLFLKLNYTPESVFYIAIVNSLICLFIRLFLLRNMIGFPFVFFTKSVLLPLFAISIFSYFLPFIIRVNVDECFFRFLLIGFTGLSASFFCIYFLGFTKEEKKYIAKFVQLKLSFLL